MDMWDSWIADPCQSERVLPKGETIKAGLDYMEGG